MNIFVSTYLSALQKNYHSERSTEHTFRPALKDLIENINEHKVLATNEPKRVECGAPDFVLTRKDIPIGYGEAKDIGKTMADLEKGEQLTRYHVLGNLFATNHLEFSFWLNGEKYAEVKIGELIGGKIVPLEENFEKLALLLKEFTQKKVQTIKSAKALAKMMANKARLMREIILKAVQSDEKGSLHDQLAAFRKILIDEMKEEEFADMYAQTIAYGLFAARLHDKTLESFSRQEAAYLVPKSNPFLRELFNHIAGPDLDDRITWIVDALANIFSYTDIREILKDFGKTTGRNDPIVHFYETFLSEYDAKLKKSRGVYYTPEPVVSFIVRSVDEILKTEFGLPDGLADKSKFVQKIDIQGEKGKKGGKKEFHKVQILDPATGTGTFLNEVIKQVHQKFEGQAGIWGKYVDEHLLPRLHGFELMMAPYAVCHLKLDLTLKETGYETTEHKKRLGVYLTNSLEEAREEHGTLFMWNALSHEAHEANEIKRETPVMVVMGNPPYSGISTNNGDWITKKIDDYKFVDGVHFGERKHWLNDDYVKFIRLAEDYIERNGEGVVAFITNHSYLDNPTFRGMRWHLLQTFDKIFIFDLHGNSKKKETTEKGGKDENVFDIQAGVAIMLAVKTSGSKKPAEIFSFDLYGKRDEKYEWLWNHSLASAKPKKLKPAAPHYFFVKKDFGEQEEYEKGVNVNKLFLENVTGIVTMGDSFAMADTKAELKTRLENFLTYDISESELKNKFQLGKNYSGWILQNKPQIKIDDKKFVKFTYRPFDTKWTYFDNKIIWRWREKVMRNFLKGDNLGLYIMRQVAEKEGFNHALISKNIIDNRTFFSSKGIGYSFPLYIYPDENQQTLDGKHERRANFNLEILQPILDKLGAVLIDAKNIQEKNGKKNIGLGKFVVSPENILDYIYAILHSPSYREKYKEFLKIDFPRVPFTDDREVFRDLAALGKELRELHLLESPKVGKFLTQYPIDGTNKIEKVKYENGKVWLNDKQYFGNVPSVAWNFFIGGYQPAQKWLKDRKNRELNSDDVEHYQKMLVALSETARITGEIDEVFKV